jgi:PAS domain-containing protein
MTATLDAAAADLQQTITDLQRKLDARTAELQEKNERYALVSQAVAEGIYDWDIRVHPDDFEHYRAALRAALKGETARLHCEYRIRLSSSEYRWVEDHALPVRDERGWAVRLVGAVSDVTDRKRHEQALREALEQQTATTEVLQLINSSPADLTPIFEAILEKAHLLCGATLGTLFLFDGEKIRATATHGYPEEVAAVLRGGIRPPPPLLDGARLVHRHDIREDGADEVGRLISQRGGVRTNLLIPLRKDGAFLGMISCNRQEVRPYTDKEIALIENFADQAVIAIENARLLGELQARTRDL